MTIPSPRAPSEFRNKPLPQTPRRTEPSAGPGGAPSPSLPSAGPGAAAATPSAETLRASDSMLGAPEMRSRAMSRSESGLQRPSNLLEPPTPTSSRPESVEGTPKLSRSGTRQALMLKKDDTAVLPPTPRSRGKVVLQEDVNIWDEGPDTPSNFVTERMPDNSVVITGGSFNKLVEKLTSPATETHGTQQSALCTSYDLYCSRGR